MLFVFVMPTMLGLTFSNIAFAQVEVIEINETSGLTISKQLAEFEATLIYNNVAAGIEIPDGWNLLEILPPKITVKQHGNWFQGHAEGGVAIVFPRPDYWWDLFIWDLVD